MKVGAALVDFVDVVLGTGLRMSEALGLVVDDVHVDDVDAAWLDVDMKLSRPRPGETRTRVPVKTDAGQRRIVLDADTARVLARLVKGKRADSPVFPDPDDGGWWTQSRVNNAWARARQLAQADGMAKSPRVHDLRHTHAAWLITDNVPLLAVSRRMGHESITVTADVYGHLLPEADGAIRGAVSGRRAAMARSGKATAGSKTAGTRRPTGRKATDTAPATRTAPERTTGRKAGARKASDTAA